MAETLRRGAREKVEAELAEAVGARSRPSPALPLRWALLGGDTGKGVERSTRAEAAHRDKAPHK